MLAGMRFFWPVLLFIVCLALGGGWAFLTLPGHKGPGAPVVRAEAVRATAQIRFASVELPPLPPTPEVFGPVRLSYPTPSPLRGEGAVASMSGAKGPLTLALSPLWIC
jgi:hypothetical protein